MLIPSKHVEVKNNYTNGLDFVVLQINLIEEKVYGSSFLMNDGNQRHGNEAQKVTKMSSPSLLVPVQRNRIEHP